MWVLSLILLGLLNEASNADLGCEIEADAECGASRVLPLEIPGSEADLQRACTNLERVKQCLADFLENCSEESSTQVIDENIPKYERDLIEMKLKRDQQKLKENKKMIDLATELCRESSQLRADFVLDMACFKKVLEHEDENYPCKDSLKDVFDYLSGRDDNTLEIRNGTIYQCLDSIFNINCYLKNFANRCSSRAKDTALEIIRRGGNFEEQCPPSIRTVISGLLKDLNIVLEEKLYPEQ
ncbi:hypothetical protein AVEN_111537-1 [Araneus ventricosus]|uniref:Secreted protein n=1 Tax=Araneus ventricosus TaxID=182803 RepID=A0A4Y2M0S7_ARAVE|nr:hypothetical protein AVEN_111537-1 [Araneus ventricosus]